MDISSYKAWFKLYTDQFLYQDEIKDDPFIIKKNHTERVCAIILSICDDLNVSAHVKELAQIIALFHDLGRFEQYARYHTFKDNESINHGIQSIKDLMRNNVLDDLSVRDRRIIFNAIRYHSVANIPLDKDDETTFFIRLIRDADKLDIWRIFIDYYYTRDTRQNRVIELGVSDHPKCSENILNSLLNGRIALTSELKTLNDFKLIQLGWIFDLNFHFSFEYVKKENIIEQFAAILPQENRIQGLIKKIVNYRDHKIKNKSGLFDSFAKRLT
jgi:hypothetical protein